MGFLAPMFIDQEKSLAFGLGVALFAVPLFLLGRHLLVKPPVVTEGPLAPVVSEGPLTPVATQSPSVEHVMDSTLADITGAIFGSIKAGQGPLEMNNLLIHLAHRSPLWLYREGLLSEKVLDFMDQNLWFLSPLFSGLFVVTTLVLAYYSCIKAGKTRHRPNPAKGYWNSLCSARSCHSERLPGVRDIFTWFPLSKKNE